ncbi:MAG: immunoglobulin-like domain-containing protein, partial [Bacilli bacterium]
MKKIFTICMLLLIVVLSGCKNNQCEEHIDENFDNICDICHEEIPVIDNIAPLFVNAVGDRLSSVYTVINNPIDLLSGVKVIDNNKGEVDLVILNEHEINYSQAGVYEIRYQATDEAGNSTICYRELIVQKLKTITYNAVVIDNNGFEYKYNDETALQSTSSGARFRLSDQLYVMEKDFFLAQYNLNKDDYTKNGGEIFFPYGALVIADKDGSFKLLRAGSNAVEVNCEGKSITPTFQLSQSENKEGLFKGIVDLVNTLIPDGGYVIFCADRDDNLSKSFIIKNLFYSEYNGGIITSTYYNMNANEKTIKLIDNFEEEVIDDNVPTEILGKVNVTEYIYDGIPLATYNYGDGTKKPVIFFFHGFSGDHTSGIMDKGEELAKRGFFVVAMDAYLHGDRAPAYFQELSYGNKQKEIVNIQIQTAKDAVHLYEKYFKNDDRVEPGNVYAFGVSMGAGSSFYLGTIMEEVKCIVSIVGSPSFYEFYQEKQEFYSWAKDNYYYTNLESYKD